MLQGHKNFIFSCSHCSYTIPFLFSLHTLSTQRSWVMVILILINVQYLQNAAFNFEKSSNGQNTPSQVRTTRPLDKKFHSAKFFIPYTIPEPHPLTLFGKPCRICPNTTLGNGKMQFITSGFITITTLIFCRPDYFIR